MGKSRKKRVKEIDSDEQLEQKFYELEEEYKRKKHKAPNPPPGKFHEPEKGGKYKRDRRNWRDYVDEVE